MYFYSSVALEGGGGGGRRVPTGTGVNGACKARAEVNSSSSDVVGELRGDSRGDSKGLPRR